jgi:Protein of unknown function (DUF3551)
MRALTMCGAAAALSLLATPAAAQGTWCAEDYGPSGYRNCGYYSFQQCLAGASGVGGFCYPSPWASSATVAEPRQRTRRSKRNR